MNLSLSEKYFKGDISHGFVSLYTGKTIVMISTGLLGLFLPIFLYNLFGNNFQYVVAYYGIGYFLYGIFVAFGAQFLNKYGFRKALRTSVVLGAAFYTIFYFLDKTNLYYLIPLSIFILVIYRLSYWLPYHIDFAKFTDKKNRGKQVSAIMATRLVIGIFIPLIGGFIISRFSFDVLFVISIILYLVSGIPYLTIPRTEEKFSWSYFEAWKQFFSKEKRRIVLAYMAYGTEEVASFVVWPIFIFNLLKGNYLQIGIVSTLIIAVTVILQLITGKYIDEKIKKEKVLKWGSILYSLGWIIKIFIATVFQVFIAGAYHHLVRVFMRTPFNVLTYDIAADNGHYVDEFTVLHEMAVQFGKSLMVVLVIVVSLFFAIQWTFAIAAVSAILFNLLRIKGAMILSRTEK